jgi:hypothetical protein
VIVHKRTGKVLLGIVALTVMYYGASRIIVGPPRLVDVSREVLTPGTFRESNGWVSDHEIGALTDHGWMMLDIETGKKTNNSAFEENRYLDLFFTAKSNRDSNTHGYYPDPAKTPEARPLSRVLPGGSFLCTSVSAPGKDRIAWLVESCDSNPVGRFIAYLHRTPYVPTYRPEIWVSEADGSRPRVLGVAAEVHRGPADYPGQLARAEIPIDRIFWSADGHSLSFEYHGGVRIADVQ